MKMFNRKKGAIGFGDIAGIALAVGLGLLVMAAIAIAVAAFQTSATASNYTQAVSVLGNTSSFFVNFATQLPTIGTVLGVMLLVGVVLAAIGGGVMLYSNVRGRRGE
jgi:hypothetical protein